MEKETVPKSTGLEVLHEETKQWISQLKFSEDEIAFFSNLLQSYVFEPDTPRLFECLQEHQKGLAMAEEKCKAMKKQLLEHENQLDGLLQLANHTLDAAYQDKHRYLREDMLECTSAFQKLKAELFRYGKTVLKKRHNRDL